MEFNLPNNTFSFLYIIQKEAFGTNIANKVIIVSNAEKWWAACQLGAMQIVPRMRFCIRQLPQILRIVIIHYASKTSHEA